jgi:hypothetical protein
MLRNGFILKCSSILVALLLLSAWSLPAASAQGETPAPDTACATCHEDLYVLHDTGKWYCSCKRRADCTVCHAGQADTFDEKLAHEGLIANPIRDNPAACQGCHGDEYEQYIQRFALIAGVSQPRKPGPTYAPAVLYVEAPIDRSGIAFAGRTFAAWQLIGLGLVAGIFLGVFVVGCRCWKKDKDEGRI